MKINQIALDMVNSAFDNFRADFLLEKYNEMMFVWYDKNHPDPKTTSLFQIRTPNITIVYSLGEYDRIYFWSTYEAPTIFKYDGHKQSWHYLSEKNDYNESVFKKIVGVDVVLHYENK